MSAVGLRLDWLPAGGRVVEVRRAREGDRLALTEMTGRCSAQTRYQRFHGHVTAIPARYLTEALAGLPDHLALVACAGPGHVVALASCRAVGDGTAELGVLVEDAWQRLGIGSALLGELVRHARFSGMSALTAQVLGEQSWIVGLLAGHGTCDSVISRAVLNVSVRLDADADT
jgi:GNAT superfamily N-acetyltransferase